jgi:hypothetical protein
LLAGVVVDVDDADDDLRFFGGILIIEAGS